MVVLLKSRWHMASPTLKPKHKIYGRLHKRKVQDILDAHHHNIQGKEDDDSCRTTPMKPWVNKAVNPHKPRTLLTLRHYRMILEYFPFTLEEFDNAREMAIIFRDASIGM